MMRFIICAFVALTLGAPFGANAQTDARSVWEMFPEHGGQGPWHSFAKSDNDLPRGGQQATLQQVVKDLQGGSSIFLSNFARTQFLRAMQGLRPDVRSSLDMARVLGDSSQTREVSCDGRIETLAHNGQGSIKPISRDCVAGEILVELLVDGQWVTAFSLGCLNPLNATITLIAAPPADPCPQVWRVPPESRADGNVVVFIPKEAIACLPPAARCDRKCEQWMRGQRGPIADRKIKAALQSMIYSGGGAYRLPAGVREVALPANLTIAPAWCDDDIHRDDVALFMKIE